MKMLQKLQYQKLSVAGRESSEDRPEVPYYSRTETLWFSFEVLKVKRFGEGFGFFPKKKKKMGWGEGWFLWQIISVTGSVRNSVYRSTEEWTRSKYNLWLICWIIFKEKHNCGNTNKILKMCIDFTKFLTALKCNWKKLYRSEIGNKQK